MAAGVRACRCLGPSDRTNGLDLALTCYCLGPDRRLRLAAGLTSPSSNARRDSLRGPPGPLRTGSPGLTARVMTAGGDRKGPSCDDHCEATPQGVARGETSIGNPPDPS